MRRTIIILTFFASALLTHAGDAKIMKVLPHLLDMQGRHSLSPSLYERDAYQAHLREHPELQEALRFDVHWKAKRAGSQQAVLRLEVRTSKEHFAKPLVLERTVKRGKRLFGRWTSLTVGGNEFKQMGELIAWRATLWAGDVLLAEQKSFLW